MNDLDGVVSVLLLLVHPNLDFRNRHHRHHRQLRSSEAIPVELNSLGRPRQLLSESPRLTEHLIGDDLDEAVMIVVLRLIRFHPLANHRLTRAEGSCIRQEVSSRW